MKTRPASPVLLVHGGAGGLRRDRRLAERRGAYEAALRRALTAGHHVLAGSGSAVDAVVEAVRLLEDEPLYNAGRGTVLCADGSFELSAAVMDGSGRAGAMAGLTRLRNPVLGAQLLLDHAHVLLAGDAADRFAHAQGLGCEAPAWFVTAARQQQLRDLHGRGGAAVDHDSRGTVGAVARDAAGHLAAATSTGGLANQLAGRIGDTPIVGAGIWAADGVCALSATGDGDYFVRSSFARRVADLVDLGGMDLEAACRRALTEIERMGGRGGCIAVSAAGTIALPFTTRAMFRGVIAADGTPRIAIFASEELR